MERLLSVEGRWHSGYGITTAADSFDVTLAPGELIAGDEELSLVGDVAGARGTPDDSVTKTLTNFGTAGETFHIYVDINGNIQINTTGTRPADAVYLWECETDANGVTNAIDHRSTTVDIDAGFEAEDLTARDKVTAERGELNKASGPEWVWTDGTDTRKLRLKSGGALAVLDGSDTELTSDLGNISNPVDETDTDTTKDKTVSNLLAKGWEDHKDAAAPHSGHEDTANKGQASGYAGLDASSLVAQAAKLVQASAPGTTDGAIGVDGSDLKFGDGTTEQVAERQSNKGAASGYAGLDSNQRVAQRTKLVSTADPGATSGGVWVEADGLHFRDTAATEHIAAKKSALDAHIGDTGTDAHGLAVAGGEAGFLSGSDKSKLDGVEAGAEVNQNAYGVIAADNSGTSTASVEQDTLTIAGGTDLTTSRSGDTITVNHDDTGLDGAQGTASGEVISSISYTRGHATSHSKKNLDSRYINNGETAGGDLSGQYPNPSIDKVTPASVSQPVRDLDTTYQNTSGAIKIVTVRASTDANSQLDVFIGPDSDPTDDFQVADLSTSEKQSLTFVVPVSWYYRFDTSAGTDAAGVNLSSYTETDLT